MFDHNWTAESIRPIVDTCLAQFGATRCMFGSNFPVDSLYSDYATLLRAYRHIIPEAGQGQVFHDTAAEFFALP